MTETRRVVPGVVLAICCTSLLLVSMDATIVNVALPTMRRDLNADTSGLQWVVDAYTMVVASLLMLAGSLADRYGRRRTFQTGMVTFTAASVLCSVAPDLQFLIAARVLQAVGASMLNPVAMSIVVNTITEPRARARAIGIWGAVLGISMALGPLVGGSLTESVGWRAIFWINVPIGLGAVLLAQRFVPESRAPKPRRMDPVGQVLVLLGITSLTYAVIEGRHRGWDSPVIVGLFVLSAACGLGLLFYEPRLEEPLIDLRFFRSIPFTGATLSAVCMFGAFSGFVFLNALYLQEVRHVPAFRTGLCTLPLALMAIVCAPISGRLVGVYGTKPSLVVSGICTIASALLLARLEHDTPLVQLVVSYLVFGIGFGLVNAPITNSAVSGMPRSRAGAAAGIASTSRQVGASLGVALGGTIASERAAHVGFAAATRPFWWLVAGCGALVLAVGVISNASLGRRSAARVASLLEDPAS